MNFTSCRSKVVAFTTIVAVCTGQPCNPNPFRPSMLPPCDSIGSKIGKAVGATIQVKAEIAALNERIYQARQRFWAVYPDGPGYAEAEIEYLTALREKNFNLLMMYLVSGMTGPGVNMINTLDFSPGVTVDQYRRRLRGDINLIDGGLNPSARPLFVQWVNALRREGRSGRGQAVARCRQPREVTASFGQLAPRTVATRTGLTPSDYAASGRKTSNEPRNSRAS
jgi:hypothetical protein